MFSSKSWINAMSGKCKTDSEKLAGFFTEFVAKIHKPTLSYPDLSQNIGKTDRKFSNKF